MSASIVRILIVDPVEVRALSIDKVLGDMGFYCVGRVSSIDEGLIFNQSGLRRFYALILAPLPLG
jgi:hypothetical protein